MHVGTTTDNKGKPQWHYGRSLLRFYGASTIKPVAPRASMVVHGLTVVMMMIFLWDNALFFWW